jgi:hypothetical protein
VRAVTPNTISNSASVYSSTFTSPLSCSYRRHCNTGEGLYAHELQPKLQAGDPGRQSFGQPVKPATNRGEGPGGQPERPSSDGENLAGGGVVVAAGRCSNDPGAELSPLLRCYPDALNGAADSRLSLDD